MEKVLIIKYGELSTKSDNINFFIKQLKNNVASKLKNIKFDIKYDYGRMIIFTENFDEALEKVKEVFGIHEICVGYLLKDRDFDNICNNVLGEYYDTICKNSRECNVYKKRLLRWLKVKIVPKNHL